ncbi:MAG: hypothetical protein K2W96_03650 [Gemmataceae bacterium]|nr:hypothetical protein [Gemmataceae bacterium]
MLALLLFALPPAPVEPEPAAPPSLVKIKAGGKIVRLVTTVEEVMKIVEVEKEVDGKKVIEKVAFLEKVPVTRMVEQALEIASVRTAGGKKLDADAAKKALDKDQVVLLASGPVDAAFLKALKDDTLVIVEKRAEGPKRPLPIRPDTSRD